MATPACTDRLPAHAGAIDSRTAPCPTASLPTQACLAHAPYQPTLSCADDQRSLVELLDRLGVLSRLGRAIDDGAEILRRQADASGALIALAAPSGTYTVARAGEPFPARAHELAGKASFEEVAYLLWMGHLPNRAELSELMQKLGQQRQLPDDVVAVIRDIPTSAHPMDALRTGVSALGASDANVFDDTPDLNEAISLTAKFPSILATFFRLRQGLEPVRPKPDSVPSLLLAVASSRVVMPALFALAKPWLNL